LIKAKEAAEKQKASGSISDATKKRFQCFPFLSNCMVDSLEWFFFADPTFPKLGCPPFFWGYRRKTKVEKKRRRVKTQVTGRVMLKSEAAFGEPY